MTLKQPPLEPDQIEVQKRFEQQFSDNLEELIARYLAQFGITLSADNARELSEGYSKGPAARARYGSAVHSTAGRLVAEIYRRLISAPSEPGDSNHVVFILGGGGGSGKSTIIENIKDAASDLTAAIYDTTLSSLKYSAERVEQAKAAGKQVTVVFVFRPLEAAVRGAVRRALDNGRCVPLAAVAHDHFEAPRNFLELASRYRDDEDVEFRVIDNSGRPEDIKAGTLELIHGNLYASPAETLRRARKAFDDEYHHQEAEEHSFPGYIYEGFTGEKLPESKVRRDG